MPMLCYIPFVFWRSFSTENSNSSSRFSKLARSAKLRFWRKLTYDLNIFGLNQKLITQALISNDDFCHFILLIRGNLLSNSNYALFSFSEVNWSKFRKLPVLFLLTKLYSDNEQVMIWRNKCCMKLQRVILRFFVRYVNLDLELFQGRAEVGRLPTPFFTLNISTIESQISCYPKNM